MYEDQDQRLRSLPNKGKVTFTELGCYPERRDGKTLVKSHEVEVRWLRNPDPQLHDIFLDQVRNYIVVGASDHIVGAQASCSENDDGEHLEDWALITPYFPRSLKDAQLHTLLLAKKITMAREIASALHWCQPHEFIHIDLSLDRIKLTSPTSSTTQGQVKLDFGIEQLLKKEKVTPGKLQERAISFGILLWKLCRKDYDKSHNCYKDTHHYTIQNIKEEQRPNLEGIPKLVSDIILSCWNVTEAEAYAGDYFSKKGDALLTAAIKTLLHKPEEQSLWGLTLENEYDLFLPKLVTTCGVPHNKKLEMVTKLKKFFFALTEKDRVMPIEAFRNLLCWCGPLDSLMEEVNAFCLKPYFFGSMTATTAAGFLSGKPAKTFLLRLNSGYNEPVDLHPYTLSMVWADGLERHYRVSLSRKEDKLKLRVSIEGKSSAYLQQNGESQISMVHHMIIGMLEGGILGTVCKGTPVVAKVKVPIYVSSGS